MSYPFLDFGQPFNFSCDWFLYLTNRLTRCAIRFWTLVNCLMFRAIHFYFGQPFEGLSHPVLDFGQPFKFLAIRLSGYGNCLNACVSRLLSVSNLSTPFNGKALVSVFPWRLTYFHEKETSCKLKNTESVVRFHDKHFSFNFLSLKESLVFT